jgi:thiamine biosynthesis lipoprotein
MHRKSLYAHHFEAMGTACSIFGFRTLTDLLRAEFWVRALAARLTRFDEGSELSRFNAAAGRWVEVSSPFESVIRASLRAYEESGGLVNVAVLPAMQAIGYTRPLAQGATAPSLEAMAVPALPDVLMVRPGQARLAPGCGVDLGGIAKGWLADRLADRMGQGVLVNLGGDLRTRGGGPERGGWPVAVGGRTLLLRDHGAATSSVRKRSWGHGLHHLIDPRTGRPARSGLVEVSVVTGTAVDAEIVAKTALLAGPEMAPAFCAAHAEAWWLCPQKA